MVKQLLETMRIESGEVLFFDEHLDRLYDSAHKLGFLINDYEVQKVLATLIKRFTSIQTSTFMRILLAANGQIEYQVYPTRSLHKFCATPDAAQVALPAFLAKLHIDATEPSIFHKNADRAYYRKIVDAQWPNSLATQQYQNWINAGNSYELILSNGQRALTETLCGNLIIKISGEYFTPPVSCGLLNGTFRRYLLKHKTIALCERHLTNSHLLVAQSIYSINSVRGFQKLYLKKNKI